MKKNERDRDRVAEYHGLTAIPIETADRLLAVAYDMETYNKMAASVNPCREISLSKPSTTIVFRAIHYCRKACSYKVEFVSYIHQFMSLDRMGTVTLKDKYLVGLVGKKSPIHRSGAYKLYLPHGEAVMLRMHGEI